MRLKMSLAFKIHLVLIRINHVHIRMQLKHSEQFIQGILCQKIIMVQQTDIIPLCHKKRCIGIARDPSVLRKLFIADPRILPDIRFNNFPAAVILAASVRQTELQIFIGLI